MMISGLVGAAKSSAGRILPNSTHIEMPGIGDGVAFAIEKGSLARAKWFSIDLLLMGETGVHFDLWFEEAGTGRAFRLEFALLNHVGARLRMPIECMNLNRWAWDREGACLKRMAYGDRIDLRLVERVVLKALRKDESPVLLEVGELKLSVDEPAKLLEPVLPKGKLMDEIGQWKFKEWEGKTASREEMVARMRSLRSAAKAQAWPESWSKWGGDARTQVAAGTGFFRTAFDGQRWWLVDPEGFRFWSAGVDCVNSNIQGVVEDLESACEGLDELKESTTVVRGVKTVNYLKGNLVRAFGEEWHGAWAEMVYAKLKAWGFNTVANWSEWQIAREVGFPYVRPLAFSFKRSRMIFRDFPDVFDPAFLEDAREGAQQLIETKEDPALIGFFLMNEPTWGFAQQPPAEGMLINAPACKSRDAFAQFLDAKYSDDASLAKAWNMPVTFEEIRTKSFGGGFTDTAKKDLEAFSVALTEKLWKGLTDACREVDPHHLNLGARYHTVPPSWALKGMGCFDVFSMNCYRDQVPADKMEIIAKELNRPVMIGEWHFGALDAGLPATGIGRVATQKDRGAIFRYYTEQAAALPQVVGVHYFTLYDQSAIGRFDGENYNIGLMDVCHREYEMTSEVRVAHERVYDVASGVSEPFKDKPRTLPRVFY